jgi:hypothetical protein
VAYKFQIAAELTASCFTASVWLNMAVTERTDAIDRQLGRLDTESIQGPQSASPHAEADCNAIIQAGGAERSISASHDAAVSTVRSLAEGHRIMTPPIATRTLELRQWTEGLNHQRVTERASAWFGAFLLVDLVLCNRACDAVGIRLPTWQVQGHQKPGSPVDQGD